MKIFVDLDALRFLPSIGSRDKGLATHGKTPNLQTRYKLDQGHAHWTQGDEIQGRLRAEVRREFELAPYKPWHSRTSLVWYWDLYAPICMNAGQ